MLHSIHTHTYKHTLTHTHINTHTNTHTNIHSHMYTHTQNIHISHLVTMELYILKENLEN